MSLTKLNLEYHAEKFLNNPDQKNEKELMDEIVKVLIEDAEIIIDGEVLDSGMIDPAHIEVQTDQRFYFHVYTSKLRFDACNGKHPYVLKLTALLDPIFKEETFGGITLNYKKDDEVVIISKENIYEAMQEYLTSSK